jgi:putative transposase
MPYDPNRHHRRSIRLRGYDYRQPGWYFVTICTHGRQLWFGTVDAGGLQHNDAGRMIERWWAALPNKFPVVRTDTFVVMPDHIHGIIVIAAPGDAVNAGDDDTSPFGVGGYANPPLHNAVDAGDDNISIDIDDRDDAAAHDDSTPVGADYDIRPPRNDNDRVDRAADNAVSLPQIIQWFKIMTTNDYIRHVKQSGWPPFDRRIWQRGYYERVVRGEPELNAARQYIAANPARRDDLDALLARMEERI